MTSQFTKPELIKHWNTFNLSDKQRSLSVINCPTGRGFVFAFYLVTSPSYMLKGRPPSRTPHPLPSEDRQLSNKQRGVPLWALQPSERAWFPPHPGSEVLGKLLKCSKTQMPHLKRGIIIVPRHVMKTKWDDAKNI